MQGQKSDSSSKTPVKSIEQPLLRRLAFYFPLRYGVCALFFAYILLGNIEFFKSIEALILLNMFHFFHIPALYLDGNLFVGSLPAKHTAARIILPVYLQILFLIFFPTIAITSRIDFKMRAKILSFGLLCFLVFIMIQFLTIAALLAVGLGESHVPFTQSSIFLIATSGALMIELALFSSIRLPQRTKIKPMIKRSFKMETIFLAIMSLTSFAVIYLLVNGLRIEEINSPIAAYATVNLNITTIMMFNYFLSYFIYEIKMPRWLKRAAANPSNNGKDNDHMSISFLVSAYNEEKIIRRCIESIDMASGKYVGGKTEILVVNDGSTDQTGKIVAEAIGNLKYSSGKLFNIPNSGKGFALKYGLQKASGDIICRIDADSAIDENAIIPVMSHFKDPEVGSVSGMIFVLEEKSLWQKTVNLLITFSMYIRRGQELFDSILVQPGAFSAYRKDLLLKVGGWADNQFGEDGELTNRIARYGYRAEFEPRSLVYSDSPESLTDLMHQRARWTVAFFHSRGRNLELVKKFNSPRSFVFLANLASNGVGFAHSLMWPYLVASILIGVIHFSTYNIPSLLGIPYRLAAVQVFVYVIELIVFMYFLNKYKRLSYIKYFPVMRFIGFILAMLVKPQAVETLLSWSCKWKEYSNEAFEDLRKEVKRSIDPKH